MKFTMSDVRKLRGELPSSSSKTLIYTKGEQMGTEEPVVVTSVDGTFHKVFYATSADNGTWTVNFGNATK
ncbi:MAG TPA: hypothetical protein VGM94_08705 [Galbitalea sp.]